MNHVAPRKVTYNTIAVGSVQVFYREAGPSDALAVLLLHGFPTSSHMFRNFIPQLSADLHVIAPDLPGFGSTSAPPRGDFAYTFDNLHRVIEGFAKAMRLERYAIYVFDYGAPVGFRLAASNPEKITAIITQNGNAYEEGLKETWEPARAYWEAPTQENRDALRGFLQVESTWLQYTHGVPSDKLNLISPDAIAHDQAILDRDPGLQLDLIGDYKTNVALYPRWQAYLREHRLPVLAVWGDGDPFFDSAGAEAFRRDVPDAEIHFFRTGHFALETDGEEIGAIVRDFLVRKVTR